MAAACLCTDPESAGAHLQNLETHQRCEDLHPGICARDLHLFHDCVLRLAMNVNTLCSQWSKWELLARAFRLRAHVREGIHPTTASFLLCEARFGRPIMQVYCPLLPRLEQDRTQDEHGFRLLRCTLIP